jgi:hypothetical protein
MCTSWSYMATATAAVSFLDWYCAAATSGGRSVGIVRSRTQTTFLFFFTLLNIWFQKCQLVLKNDLTQQMSRPHLRDKQCCEGHAPHV